jgi:hypothetical protein
VKRSVERPARAVRCPCRLLLARRDYRAQFGTPRVRFSSQQTSGPGSTRDGTHCRPHNRWIRAISPSHSRPTICTSQHGRQALVCPGTVRRLRFRWSPSCHPRGVPAWRNYGRFGYRKPLLPGTSLCWAYPVAETVESCRKHGYSLRSTARPVKPNRVLGICPVYGHSFNRRHTDCQHPVVSRRDTPVTCRPVLLADQAFGGQQAIGWLNVGMSGGALAAMAVVNRLASS